MGLGWITPASFTVWGKSLAYQRTVGNIIDRALKRADMYTSGYIDPQECLDYFNEAYTQLYDLLISAGENYKVSTEMIPISPATTTYALPEDFYKAIGVDMQVGGITSTQYITLRPFTNMERNGMLGTTGILPSAQIRLRYAPAPTIYTDRDEVVDGIAGWDKLIVLLMAYAMKDKDESSVTALERDIAMQMERIEVMKQNRDQGMPGRVNDIYSIDMYAQYASCRYQILGNNVEFLSTEVVTAAMFGIY